jgi:hypothetical protein
MNEGVVNMSAASREDFETRDIFLLSALMAVGVRPVGRERCRVITPEHEHGRRYQYFLSPVSECGKWQTVELVKAWKEGVSWIEKNPEHPFAYAMAAQWNFKETQRELAGLGDYVFMRAGDAVAMLPSNATAEMEEKILGKFDR